MTGLPLRGYQWDMIEAVRGAWRNGMMRPAGVLPTGAGKTVTMCKLIEQEFAAGGVERVLVLAHREELINQWVGTLRVMAPHLRTGVVQGTVDQTGADVVVGMVPTLQHASRRARVRNVGRVVVDECHHATAKSYRDVLGHFGSLDDTVAPSGLRALAVGVTATMSRGDGVGLGEVWQDVVFRRSIAHMIRDGFLVEPVGVAVHVEDLNMDKVRKVAGDYQSKSLGTAMTNSLAPKRILEAWQQHAAGRLTMGFAPSVDFAHLMAAEFNAAGITSAVVWGDMPTDDRRQLLSDFAAGKVTVVWNYGVLTEGTDVPPCSCVIMARPTTHQGLYVQIVGRGLRTYPGKTDCVVLDVSGASRRHALTINVDLIGTEDVAAETDDAEIDVLDMLEKDLEESGDRDDQDDMVFRDGRLVAERIDLFHGSRLSWYQTRAGLWFLPVGNRYLSIVPCPGGLAVAERQSFAGGAARWVHWAVPDVSMAMALAESEVTDGEREVAARDARYRMRHPNAFELRSWRALNPFEQVPATVGDLRRQQVIGHASEVLDPGYVRWLASQQPVK